VKGQTQAKDQWYAYLAAWLGWTLDAFDFTIFLLIMLPISQCTAPGSLDNGLAYAARLKVSSCQAIRMSAGLRWPFFSISHSAL
jgi:hypothetical protein